MTTESRQHIRWFRNSAPYINAHRGRTFVLMFGGEAAEDPNFPNVIHDLALLNSLGVRIVVVYGTRPQIASRLDERGLETRFHNNLRITDASALTCAKEAAGTLRTEIEALFSMGLPNSPMHGSSIRVCSGNFVTARPLGVIEGVDYLNTGAVRRVDTTGINRQLDDGALVLLAPLGYSPTGEVFNLSVEDVATKTAAALQADKLIVLGSEAGITDSDGQLIRQAQLSAVADLIENASSQEQFNQLRAASEACAHGVARCQVLSYRDDCALLEELFTHTGSGTLISHDGFEVIRVAEIDDVGGIIELISPLEEQGVLVRRSRELLEMEIHHFTVMERDGRIIGCAALYPYTQHGNAELACIVTDQEYRGRRQGERLLKEVELNAARLGLTKLFVLTTQTAHWFLEQGFVQTALEELPEEKQALYNYQRNSKVFRKTLSA